MNKKMSYGLVFILAFFCLIMSTYAETKYVSLLDAVNIRKGPGTNYSRLVLGQVGSTYNLKNNQVVADEPKNEDCDEGWYQIDYNGSTAYVCSSYVQVYTKSNSDNKEPTTECEKEMQKAGFPSSYWEGLCSLKKSRPNWTFKAIQTNLEWASVIEKQSACGKSLIQTNNSEYLDSSCTYKEGSFKAASQKALAFYMDPRNFLSENYIFQFEYLKYDKDLANEYIPGAIKLYGNAAFYKYHLDKGNDLAKLVTQAGLETDVSPISLAARMYQELGSSDYLYNLYGGVYTGYDNAYYGYYNFYNIGVSGSCISNYGSSYCGLDYAKRSGWNSVYAAVKGGATFLSSGYISKGQYTNYLQKYNVVPTNSSLLHTHQYMTNIAAPSSEARTTYSTYNKLGILDKAFAFYIPVYANMDSTIDNSPSGETPDDSQSTPSTSSSATIVISAGYKLSGGYVSGVKIGTSVASMKASLESIAGSGNIVITNAKGSSVTTGKVGTGFKVKIVTTEGTTTYNIVIKGDTSGDGVVNALDLLQVQKSILGTYSLKDSYLKAGDTSGDGKINALDLLQVQKNILGTFSISQ